MLDDQVRALLHKKMTRAVVSVNKGLGEREQALRNQLLPRGQTGSYLAQVLELAKPHFGHQAIAAWNAAREVLDGIGIEYSDTLADEVCRLLDGILPPVDWLKRYLFEVAQRTHVGPNHPAQRQINLALGIVEVNRANAPRRVREDAVIYAMGLKAKQKKESAVNHTVNIHGPNFGNVASGTNATINVQQFQPGEVAALREALDQVIQHLTANTEIGDSEEAIELATETKEELSKDKPRWARIKANVTGVATTIRTVHALAATYAFMKNLLAPHGIALP